MDKPFKNKLAVLLFRLVGATWRIKTVGKEPSGNSIIAFWHGTMMPVWKYFKGKNYNCIVSQSKDGQLLTDILEKWNYNPIRGSSSRGGKEALDEIVRAATNNTVLITPDGPRGPYHEFKAGAVIASIRSCKPLILCKVEIQNGLVFKKSWDRFTIPYPFSTIILHFSDPEHFKQDLSRTDIEIIIKRKEAELNTQS